MKLILPLIFFTVLSSCAEKKIENQFSESKSKQQSNTLYVDTLHLKKQTFHKQIICNGKLRAVLRSTITFPTQGEIAKINIQNGAKITKGSLMAQLDLEDATLALDQAKRMMNKSQLDLTDKLIGQGYDADTTQVPASILENVKHTSGYNTALDNLDKAKRNLKDCSIYAPFSGRVANVEAKIYDRTEDALCTLIDDAAFDVEFNILEAELTEVSKGQEVSISPFIDEERVFLGQVTEINPLIDEKGQVKVRARVANKKGFLLEGMNVNLTLNRAISNQYVVPKEAVVLRDGYHVVFRYEDGEAVWTYVTVVMSNINSHLITGHEEKGTELHESDVIITSGNRNLADGVKVGVKARR